ncbi:helix-turn-helix domain-containing protein [Patulibacter sp. S7RM1-6]
MHRDPVAAFAAQLRVLRLDAEMTQDQLGGAAGLDAREIRRYEAGERDPGLRTVNKLARALGVTVPELLDET